MKLFYTPRSHFSRKVIILANALNLDLELLDAGNVAESTTEAFGQNPLMKVPTLVDDGVAIFESDHIAQYLVRRHDPADRFGVLTEDTARLNARSVMNGIMTAEVELILAARAGMDTNAHARFGKLKQAIGNGLDWLERHAEIFPASPSYLGFHLTAMWDHLALYATTPLHHEKLRDRVASMSALAYVSSSAPVP